jgi:hypothetical protein
MQWSALPRAASGPAKYFAQLFDPRREAPVWSQPAASDGGTIDGRVLEDSAAKAAVTARATLNGATGTKDVHAAYLSARLPVQPLTGAPPSRNRPCFAVSGTAPNLATTRQSRCAATDGNLISSAGLHATKAANVTGVVVDLGRPRRIDLVVARGVAGMYTIELSKDDRTYVSIGTTSASPGAVQPAGSPVARYVRVRSPGGLTESLLTEISVW